MKTAHALSIELDRPFYTYGDTLQGRLPFKSHGPLVVQSLTLRFNGVSGCITAKTATYEETKSLFDHDLALISSAERLTAGTHIWMFEFFWPQRDDADLVANFEPERAPPLCYFRYELTTDVEFIDSKHHKGRLNVTRSPTFVSSRVAATEPNFQNNLSPLATSLKSRLLSLKANFNGVNGTQLSLFDVLNCLSLILKTPGSVVTKSPIPLSIMVKHLSSDIISSMAPIRLVAFRLYLNSKLNIKLTSAERPPSSPLEATTDFKKERGYHVRKLASFSASNIDTAPTLSADGFLDLASRLGLRMPHLRASFTTETVTFSYSFTIKARVEHQGRIFTAKWSDVAVDILPNFIQPDQGAQSVPTDPHLPPPPMIREPSFQYITFLRLDRGHQRSDSMDPPRTPSPPPLYEGQRLSAPMYTN
jgi:hypothetical protein